MRKFTLQSVILFLTISLFLIGCHGNDKSNWVEIDTWEFVPHKFIQAETDVAANWKGVVIPDKWPGNTMESFGYGTYRARLHIDPSVEYGIQVGDVLSSYRLFMGDSLIASAGVTATERSREIPKVDQTIHRIPRLPEENQPGYIYLQVSNFNYHVGGFLRPVKLAPYQELVKWRSKQLIKEAVQCGALFIIGVFLIIYYLFRRKEAYIFFFGILSLGLMFRMMLSGQMIGLEFIPEISGEALLKIILVTFYMGISLNYVVLAGIFEEDVPDWSRQIVFIAGIVMSVFLLVAPLYIGSFSTPVFQLFALVSGIFVLYCIFKAALKHRTGAKTVLVGGVITFAFLVNDILYNMQYVDTGNFIGWAVIIYLLLIIVAIARRFSSAMENEEGLLEKLANINRDLELRVMERTRMIEKHREKIEMEAALAREQNRHLKQVQEEENTIKSIMVHDLRAPFNKILGLAKILRMNSTFGAKEENEISEMILRVAEEGRLLIDELNTLNVYESHLKETENSEQTDINNLLRECVNTHEAYAQSKNISLQYQGHHMVTSFINPSLLSRIIDNLLSNAIKFSKEGTTVKVQLIRKNGLYEIIVQDQGPGFTEADMKKVFGKFQKLSARPTHGEASTGLGLSIVKNLTELLGGKVNLYSESGKGARFVLIFQVVDKELYVG